MPAMHLQLDGDHDRVGRELGLHRLPVLHTVADWTVDPMEHGMESGATSLMVLIPAQVEGIDVVVAAETSLQCWMTTATALAGKFHEEVSRPGWASFSPAARAILEPRIAEAIRRAIPTATGDNAAELATMIVDGLGSDGPNIRWAD